jgi:hypothetical protein
VRKLKTLAGDHNHPAAASAVATDAAVDDEEDGERQGSSGSLGIGALFTAAEAESVVLGGPFQVEVDYDRHLAAGK